MREVLFKAKRIGDGEWVQGYLFRIWEKAYILWGATNDIPDMIEVSPETVCQYTGLTDKNGNRIWKNDIVRFKHEKFDFDDELNPWKRIHCQKKEYKRNYVVEFCNTPTHYGLRLRNGSIWFKVHKMTILMHDAEVIGNIFDNPELLEVE